MKLNIYFKSRIKKKKPRKYHPPLSFSLKWKHHNLQELPVSVMVNIEAFYFTFDFGVDILHIHWGTEIL